MSKKILFIILGISVTFFILFIFVGKNKLEEKNIKNSYNFISPEKKDIIQTVNVDGVVVATNEVDLRFQINGVIEEINYKIGETVKKGDVLARLVANDQEIAVSQRLAGLKQTRANLNLKLAGSSDEDVAIYQSKVDNADKIVETTMNSVAEDIKNSKARVSLAEVSLSDATRNLEAVKNQNKVNLNIAYESTGSLIDSSILTIEKTLDEINDILEADDLEDVFSVKDILYKTESDIKYFQAKNSFENILNTNKTLNTKDYRSVDDLLSQVKTSLNDTNDLLNSVFNGLVSTVTSSVLSQTSLEAYKNTVNSLRIGINKVISNIESKEQSILSIKTASDTKITNANSLINIAKATLDLENANLYSVMSKAESQNVQTENSLQLAKDNLALKVSSPRDVDVAYLRARVSEALASLDLAQENLNKTSLLAPVDGIIVDIKFELGESINTSNVFIRLIANEKKIEADIPEIEISKVNIGNMVKINLDAFTDRTFGGEIVSIDPVETNIQGVVYYKTDITFSDATSSRVVLPGMTADINILTAFRENVLSLPRSSVKSEEDEYYVQIFQDNELKIKSVEIGLVGDERVEIVGGLEESEKVIDFILKTN